MSKEIPFFSARQINAVEEYERFYHTKLYLQSLSPLPSGGFKLTGKDRQLFDTMQKACGYAHYSKFVMHKNEWDRLERKMPLSYLHFLGVNRTTLDFVLDLDYGEYEEALTLPRHPRFATVRLTAAVYVSKPIPGNMLEEEAVEYLYDVVKEKGFQCCINYPELKTIFIDSKQGVNTVYYPPEIEFTKLYAVPRRDGRMIGKSCLV
jgi:hypothetical protein